MMHLLPSNPWLIAWYIGVWFAGTVLPAKLAARCAGVRGMNQSFAILILKKIINILFRLGTGTRSERQ